MAEYTLVLYEVTSIQNYVFRSNHLAQNIGASEIVEQVSESWLVEALDSLSLRTNAKLNQDGRFEFVPNIKLSAGNAEIEVIYRGGGKALLLFANEARAIDFTKKLTRKALEDAPGLQLVVAREKFDWKTYALSKAHSDLYRDLETHKLDRRFSTPLVGLGVTAKCVFTGMPAVGWDDDLSLVGKDAAAKKKGTGEPARLISAEVAAKLRYERLAKQRLYGLHDRLQKEGFEFAHNFNEFGERGESSYIAVIHTDGNDMGERFSKIGEKFTDAAQNEEYLNELREFSLSIERNSKKTLISTIDLLLDNWQKYLEQTNKDTKQKPGSKKLLPFRPIVFGGDDVTFVCEGRLGLPLAAKYLQEYTKKFDDGKYVFARAGVAVVKSHYPFSRAYELAEDLARSAKEEIGKLRHVTEDSASVMDWHFTTSGVELGLETIRKREYSAMLIAGERQKPPRSLLMRPIRVKGAEDDKNIWRNWSTFARLVKAFQGDDTNGEWAGRRNKVKALRDALRQDEKAVKMFLVNYGREKPLRLPEIPTLPDMSKQGWSGDDCGYFDAIEAIDFFISLE